MTLSKGVQNVLFKRSDGDTAASGTTELQVVIVPPTRPAVEPSGSGSRSPAKKQGNWTREEHNLFIKGLVLFPSGPWKKIADHVGTRTARQVMTHAQKYRQKIARRKRGLKKLVRDRPAEEDEDENENEEAGNVPPATEDEDRETKDSEDVLMLPKEELAEFINDLELSDDEFESPLVSPAAGSRSQSGDSSAELLNALSVSDFSQMS